MSSACHGDSFSSWRYHLRLLAYSLLIYMSQGLPGTPPARVRACEQSLPTNTQVQVREGIHGAVGAYLGCRPTYYYSFVCLLTTADRSNKHTHSSHMNLSYLMLNIKHLSMYVSISICFFVEGERATLHSFVLTFN